MKRTVLLLKGILLPKNFRRLFRLGHPVDTSMVANPKGMKCEERLFRLIN